MIEKYSENEIFVFTYSEIENKYGDVKRLRRSSDKGTEFKQIDESMSIFNIVEKNNRTHRLCIDITFAAPYHAMQMTSFGYIDENRV